jgi:hypothetical protein
MQNTLDMDSWNHSGRLWMEDRFVMLIHIIQKPLCTELLVVYPNRDASIHSINDNVFVDCRFVRLHAGSWELEECQVPPAMPLLSIDLRMRDDGQGHSRRRLRLRA